MSEEKKKPEELTPKPAPDAPEFQLPLPVVLPSKPVERTAGTNANAKPRAVIPVPKPSGDQKATSVAPRIILTKPLPAMPVNADSKSTDAVPESVRSPRFEPFVEDE